MLSWRTMYVVTLRALHLLVLFYKRRGDITLVRHLWDVSVSMQSAIEVTLFESWKELACGNVETVEYARYVCKFTQIKIWCDCDGQRFFLGRRFLVMSVLNINSSLIYSAQLPEILPEHVWLGWVSFCVMKLQSISLEVSFSHQASGGLFLGEY